MKAYGALLGILVLGCLLAGCGTQPGADSNAAIQKAIEDHLAGRAGLATDKMTMEMKDIRISGEQAEAEVVFRTTSDPPAQMSFRYQLRKEGKQWRVQEGSPSVANSPHPSSPAPGSDDQSKSLPGGHPPVTSPH